MTTLQNDADRPAETVIRIEGAAKSFRTGMALQGVSFTVRRGECFGILGPNGSGKSTLLRIMSGVEAPSAGAVEIEGKPIAAYGRKALARRLAVLQQDALPPVGFTVREVVEMGRYPYQSWLGEDEPGAVELVDGVMKRLGLQPMAGRAVDKLSGGEKQRVALAKVMAQQPQLLLLDEPTTFLDIGYQLQMMDYIKSWQREAGLTVVAVLHDVNLAAQYCDRLLVMRQGQAVAEGKPELLVRSELIADVYGTEPIVLAHPDSGVPQILLRAGRDEKKG